MNLNSKVDCVRIAPHGVGVQPISVGVVFSAGGDVTYV